MRFKLNCQDEPNDGQPARFQRQEAGLTLVELLVSIVLVAVVFGTIVNSYISSAIMAEWTGYSLAAQQIGVQCLEQSRSAVWDIALGKCEITNMALINSSWNASNLTYTGYTTNILDVPYKGTNYVMVTNFITIQTIYENNSSNVPVQLQVIRVDTVWPFNRWGNYSIAALYTNSIATYIAPDNRDPTTLGAQAD